MRIVTLINGLFVKSRATEFSSENESNESKFSWMRCNWEIAKKTSTSYSHVQNKCYKTSANTGLFYTSIDCCIEQTDGTLLVYGLNIHTQDHNFSI